jgi:hypothetical protein
VLVLGAVAGLVTHLRQRVVEAVVLRGLRELDVVVVAPVGALFDVAGDQAAADVGHPVRELNVVGYPFSRHSFFQCSSRPRFAMTTVRAAGRRG